MPIEVFGSHGFVKSYEFENSANFRGAITVKPVGADLQFRYLAFGSEGDACAAVLTDQNGDTIWSCRYSYGVAKSWFNDGLLLTDGDGAPLGFVLLAAGNLETRGRQAYLVTRIDLDGNVLWARNLHTSKTRIVRRIVASGGSRGGYLVCGWANDRPGSSRDDLELIRIGRDGEVLAAAHVKMAADNELFDAMSIGDFHILVGHSIQRGNLVGFALVADDMLQNIRAISFSGLEKWRMISPRSVYADLQGHIVFAGRASPDNRDQSSLIFSLDPRVVGSGRDRKPVGGKEQAVRWGTVTGHVYRNANGEDLPRRVVRSADDYLVLDQPQNGNHPTVMRFDADLKPVAHHGFSFDTPISMSNLHAGDTGRILLVGTDQIGTAKSKGLFIATGHDLACCKTESLPLPKMDQIEIDLAEATLTATPVETSEGDQEVRQEKQVPVVKSHCGATSIPSHGEQLLQSPYLALQVAGSSPADATSGFLLRWHLLGKLGESHLPKGEHAKSNVNFNKPDDFVTLFRAPWPQDGLIERRFSFETDLPVHADHANALLVFETSTVSSQDTFYVRFLDKAAYSIAKSAVNPLQDLTGFLNAYGDKPLGIELRNKLALRCNLEFLPRNSGYNLRLETLSVSENRPSADVHITSRHIFNTAQGSSIRVDAENMRRIRFAGDVLPTSVSFICYDDVLSLLNEAQQWEEIDKFSLATSIDEFSPTTNNTTVFNRLENLDRFEVNGKWSKFNDGAFVNVANYKARWTEPNDGLGVAVATYLSLSEQDPQAEVTLAGEHSEDGVMPTSYLDLIQLAALDFHAARMLGLGTVDTGIADPARAYVYMAEYMTLGDLGDGKGAREVQHLYMSLPTFLAQHRLPMTPSLGQVDYGLSVETASGDLHWLTDSQGYTPDGLARYIRLYPDCPVLYEDDIAFFASSELFDLAEMNLPVCYGIEYRTTGAGGWREPEIAHDAVFVDTAGTPEAMASPFPETRFSQPFVHKETEDGFHDYATYGIDIFSRASALSDVRSTDETKLRQPNRLLPPSDLHLQLIQEELPRILTTQAEQNHLETLKQSGADETFVRLTFNYGHVQEANHGFADYVELLFRRQPPAMVAGGVKNITATADSVVFEVETQPYTYLSNSETVVPTISAGEKANFIGSTLVIGDQHFKIEGISLPNAATGENPVFQIKVATVSGVEGTVGGNALLINPVQPQWAPNDLFMVVENMASGDSWGAGNPLATTVQIGDPSWTETTETYVDDDGTTVTRKLRGIWESAKVENIPLNSNQFTITFDTYGLAPHPQSSALDPVSWYRGVARVSVQGKPDDDRRALTVRKILDDGNGKLVLVATDDTGELDPIRTGSGLTVNVYPGYKVYLHADAAHGFEAQSVMPAASEGSRTSIMATRSVDNSLSDDLNNPYRSAIGVPQILLAQEIINPLRPDQPMGLAYATPPDGFGKSSYTFDVKFSHEPFAVVFYRADAFSILRALYDQATLTAIREKIFPPEKDAFFANRWADLLDFDKDRTGEMTYQAFDLDGTSYALPHPDALAFQGDTAKTLEQLKDKIIEEIGSVFLPLTEQPLIHSLVRDNAQYVPTNAKQVFRNANGDILAPGDAGFDLAPMAKRYVSGGKPVIQFTDFTLDGSMNPNTVYFYFAREIGNKMQMGDFSPMLGPIKLINLSPPETPILRKIATVPFDVTTGGNPEVRFEIVAPSKSDPITAVRIYRSASALDAISMRSMVHVKDCPIDGLAYPVSGTIVIGDNFLDDPFVPYGEPLYYRLAFVREVTYEDASGDTKTAKAVSHPTKQLLTNLVDIVNPEAPVPTVSSLSAATDAIKSLRMSWGGTVYNGTYYISQLDQSGNWMRLADIQSNDTVIELDLPDALPAYDEDGDPIYYRFRVDVENSSGLFNIEPAPVTVSLVSL